MGEEFQLWRDVILWASVLDDSELLSFGQIQEVIQVDIRIEQDVHGGHEVGQTPLALRYLFLYDLHQQPCNEADPYLDGIAVVPEEVLNNLC